MAACQDQDEWLTLFAAGALEPEEEARVRAHLESCAACHSEAQAHREVLALAAPPPLSAREQAVLAALPRTTVSAWRGAQVRQAARMRTSGALMAAAAVVLLTLGPVVQRRVSTPPQPAHEEPRARPPEESFALEQWALADPLADALELSDVDLDESEPGAEPLDFESEDFLSSPNPGDSL